MNYPILLNREKPAKAEKISDGVGMFNFFMSGISLGRALALLMVPVLLLTASCKKDKETPAPTFTVTFEANEGSEVKPQTITEKEKATKPENPTREGYTFIGWYTDEALTDAYDFDTPITEAITLYAKWEEAMVTYDLNPDDPSTGIITGLTEKFEDAEDVHLKIPATINGVKMTTIAPGAFKRRRNIISLEIAEGIETIGGEVLESGEGNGAFQGCAGIKGELSLPGTLTTIGYGAFSFTGLEGDLTIPNSVTTIEGYAFSGCFSLNGNLTIGNAVEAIGGYAFFLTGLTGELTIPNSVTTIEGYAFAYCTGFTGELTIPNSVTTIEESTFSGCTGLTGELTIPNSVTTIGRRAFSGCTGFTGKLTIPNSVTDIGGAAFSGCTGFTGVTIPNSVTIIGGSAFSGCTGLTGELTIPNSVTIIGSSAFSGCTGLTGELTIPNSVTDIGGSAFMGCTGLTGELTLGDAIEVIGLSAFSETMFTTIVVLRATPPGLSFVIGEEPFPDTVESIRVPAAAVGAYQAEEGWNNYRAIITAQ